MRSTIVLVLVLFTTLLACQPQANPTTEVEATEPALASTEQFPEKAAALTVYEVNIRQHTPEGTISAFVDDLPRLKDIGIGILWIMPVQPIGVKN